MIIAKKDTKSSQSIKSMAAATAKCSFAALFSLLQLPIASGLVQSYIVTTKQHSRQVLLRTVLKGYNGIPSKQT